VRSARPAALSVQVTPRAHENALLGWRGDVLLVRVTAPPVDGKANAALVKLLAHALDLAASDISIVAGTASRRKTVALDGIDALELRQRLALGDL
jgi:uncharacterized protein (TIGR00251 family)